MASDREYLTISSVGNGEYTEKKSRFLGEIHPVTTEEEAAAVVAQARKRYYDARHHCYAWILGDDGSVKKASDDGEPSGTAGIPILKVIDGAGLRNVVVVVTRYFGGTLLGTGGLVRSYTQAAQAAVANAQIARMCRCRVYRIGIAYSLLDKLLYYLRTNEIEPYEQIYTDSVSMCITVEEERAEQIVSGIVSLTGGTVEAELLEEGFFPIEEKG
jgi:uncharacterized YigZ family protein